MSARPGWGNVEERRALLIEVLRSGTDDAACQACLGQLDEYVTTQLAGEDYMARFSDLATHLDTCPDCADIYARLYELELAEATDRLPQLAHLPEPDLSFLFPGATPPLSPAALRERLRAAALTERLRAALQHVGDRLILQLSAELVSLLQPPPVAAQVRTPVEAERYGEVLLVLKPDEALRPDLPIALTAYRDAHNPETGLVEVVVEPPGRSWPELEGFTVALIVADERHEATTDAWGLAAFEDIPTARLADLTLEIAL